MPIDAIAEKIGCQDGTTLRKLVKREFGTTPGALRSSPAGARRHSVLGARFRHAADICSGGSRVRTWEQ